MASQNQGQFETASSVTRVKMLLNKNLINICKDEKLSHSGVKMVLQSRIIGRECPGISQTLSSNSCCIVTGCPS